MKFIKTTLILILIIAITSSCKKDKKQISNILDYNKFLTNSNSDDGKTTTSENLAFWQKKLEKNPTQYIYSSKIASIEGQLFGITGNIEYLKKQERKLIALNKKMHFNNASFLRALAKNYITQHRFRESLDLLLKAEKNGEKLVATQRMLFDVYLELGNSNKAEIYLTKIKNFRSFDFLIRLSKWKDHNGDLDNAIYYMESAMKIAENSNNETLKKWVYTNIADYYGHAGNIEKSYNHYLKALAINPNEEYAKKGIAWIVFSYEKNPKEALRIINSLKNNLPDYYLLKAKISEFQNNNIEKKKHIENYLHAINNPKYGNMYNKYTILLDAEKLQRYDEAIRLATLEIKNRPTTQSYDLLAWSYYNKGEFKKALTIINDFVLNKTSEPEVIYHIVKIFKANNIKIDKSNLSELINSSFELGPNLSKEIMTL